MFESEGHNRWYKGGLVAVQNGINSNRVLHCRLSADGTQVTKTEVLEYHTPMVSSPTTGAIVGGNFYFITDTRNSAFRNGQIVDPAKLAPIQIALVPLDR